MCVCILMREVVIFMFILDCILLLSHGMLPNAAKSRRRSATVTIGTGAALKNPRWQFRGHHSPTGPARSPKLPRLDFNVF